MYLIYIPLYIYICIRKWGNAKLRIEKSTGIDARVSVPLPGQENLANNIYKIDTYNNY